MSLPGWIDVSEVVPRLCHLPYLDLSQELLGPDEELDAGLALDERHTLIAVRPDSLEALWRPSIEGSLAWLVFRSGSGGGTARTDSPETTPDLWFEGQERRVAAELRESAGWGELTAAVALYELPPVDPDLPTQLTRCGIQVQGRDVTVELPPAWLDHLRAALPARR